MAKIVLGLGSSHAPQLELPPERWQQYGDRGRAPPQARRPDVYNYGTHPGGHAPAARVARPTDSTLAQHLIGALIADEFDLAISHQLPTGRDNGAIGHAFYYVYRRLMHNVVTPN